MLHSGPYKGELEDRLAFLTSLCLTLSLLLGLCLMMDDASNPIFPADEIGIILILINVLPFVHFIFFLCPIDEAWRWCRYWKFCSKGYNSR